MTVDKPQHNQIKMKIASNDVVDDNGCGNGGKKRIGINNEKENVNIQIINNGNTMMKQELLQSAASSALMKDTTTAAAANNDNVTTATTAATSKTASTESILSRSRHDVIKLISKMVLRNKLQKLRHLVLPHVISSEYLEHDIFVPYLLSSLFKPQVVQYNGGIANITQWKISCYLEVMEGGVPCTNPNVKLFEIFHPLLRTCDDLFLVWYKQQHACNNKSSNNDTKNKNKKLCCKRLMTFVTRYTPNPGEQSLLKHVDGAGKVDGSVVIALPTEKNNSFDGYGGGLTFWDGRQEQQEEDAVEVEEEEEPVIAMSTTSDNSNSNVNGNGNEHRASLLRPSSLRQRQRRRRCPREIHYDTRSGDIAFIDKAVWHQADPITKGARWALVIFYKIAYVDDKE